MYSTQTIFQLYLYSYMWVNIQFYEYSYNDLVNYTYETILMYWPIMNYFF